MSGDHSARFGRSMLPSESRGYSSLGETPVEDSDEPCASVGLRLFKLVSEWWALSTSESYRSSLLSRRRIIPLAWPIWVTLAALQDLHLFPGANVRIVDAVFWISSLAVFAFRSTSWWLDVLAAAETAMYAMALPTLQILLSASADLSHWCR